MTCCFMLLLDLLGKLLFLAKDTDLERLVGCLEGVWV